MRIRDIINRLGGECVGDDSLEISAVNAAADARAGEVTFVGNPRYLSAAEASGATALVVPLHVERSSKTVIRTPNVLLYTAELIGLLHPEERPRPGVHPSAVVAASVRQGERLSVGANAVVDDGASIGDDCIIGPGAYIGRHCTIGAQTRIHANAVVHHGTRIGRRVIIHSGAVIGADGFRFIPTSQGPKKIPQVGIVQIDDDVEIGANTCIDRATFGVTHIQSGVKIDNLVQVGHNCVVGAGSILVSQCGLSGSVKLGRGVIMGGQSGIAEHVTVGDQVQIGGGSGVRDDIPPGERWIGYPARHVTQFVKETTLLPKLAKLYGALRRLVEKQSTGHSDSAAAPPRTD